MTAMSDVITDSVNESKHNLDDPPSLEDNPWAMSSGLPMDIIPDSSVDFGDMPQLENQEPASAPCSSPVAGTFFGPEPAPFSLSYRRDVKDANAEQGNAGLHNMGNTCFMNAGLQCLLCNPRLVKHFLEDLDLNEEFQVTLTGQYASLVSKMWSGLYTIVHPSEFKETLAMYHPQFKDYQQHDCQEFLALLLDSLHEQLNTAPLQNKFPSLELEAGPYYPCKVENDVHGQSDSYESMVHQSDSVSEPDTPTQNNSQSVSPPNNVITNNVQPHCLSEDSNQSEPSHLSVESSASADCSHRSEPLPESVKLFGSGKVLDISSSCSGTAAIVRMKETAKVENIDIQGGGDTFGKTPVSSEGDMTDVTDVEPTSEELDERKLPSLEDLYMKDTKTLNTNVLATEYEHTLVATDSEKFHKEENTNRPVNAQDEIHTFEQLNDMLVYESAKDNPCKPVKETNLLANQKDKFSDNLYSKKSLFSELEQAEEENCSINNIKRMKVDEEEKNVRMQVQMKKNMDKNLVAAKNIVQEDNFANVRHDLPSVEQTLSAAMEEGDQLLSQDHRVIAQGSGLNNEDHMRLKDIRDAKAAWNRYQARNKSVVVDTFQGQFKSTVICSECNHISVTFEPFMYLSVPIPYAMDRQIGVIFVPCDNKQPIRYLITLNKQDHIRHLKHHLLQLIGEETCDIIVAEVLDNHIARILEDNTMLRFVNDNDRQIYAFEMIPPPQIDDVSSQSDDVTSAVSSDVTSTSDGDIFLFPNNIAAASVVSSTVNNASLQSGGAVACTSKQTSVNPIDISYLLSSPPTTVDKCVTSTTGYSCSSDTNLLNNSIDGSVSSWTQNLELREDVDWQRNLLGPADSTEPVPSTSDGLHSGMEPVDSTKMDDMNTECGDVDTQDPGEIDMSDNGGGNQADQWKSCAICLEEMVDSDLMVHTSCGGTLCQSCLEMSFKHYGETTFVCPVCSTPVDPVEGFVQLNCMADYKPKTRILSVPVIHRYDYEEEEEKKMCLFGHPNILYLASNMSGEFLYASVDRVVACLSTYSIILTDGQGYRCSRCLYTAHCSGCEVSRDGQVCLQPGDHLAVQFTDLTSVQRELAQRHTDHKSMEKLRPNVPLTLFDCFEAFTESEVLDEHNPWYCPRCKRNRCANKTMTVWRYPETLVVYLKRFVYHELSSTKIDTKVEFSLEKLDLSGYISGPETSHLLYDLQSCVCHFGGANSGHYTSYAKHPTAGEWYYYNDETITSQRPREEDYSNAYILFYQRRGTERLMRLPDKKSLCCAGEELPGTSYQTVDMVPYQSEPLNNESVSEMLQKYKKTQRFEVSEDKELEPDSTNLDFYS